MAHIGVSSEFLATLYSVYGQIPLYYDCGHSSFPLDYELPENLDYSPWAAEDKTQQVDKRMGTEVATGNGRFFQELGLGGQDYTMMWYVL